MLFQNTYVDELKKSIAMVDEMLNRFSDEQIYRFINRNIGKWAGEFETDLFAGGK